MAKFRKKPVVVEAFQMTREARFDDSDWPQWFHDAWLKEDYEEGAVRPMVLPANGDVCNLSINTLGGKLIISWDDWIIQGVAGELYPCKNEIFEATYEAI